MFILDDIGMEFVYSEFKLLPPNPVLATSSDTLRGLVNLGVTPPLSAPGVPRTPGANFFSHPLFLYSVPICSKITERDSIGVPPHWCNNFFLK